MKASVGHALAVEGGGREMGVMGKGGRRVRRQPSLGAKFQHREGERGVRGVGGGRVIMDSKSPLLLYANSLSLSRLVLLSHYNIL